MPTPTLTVSPTSGPISNTLPIGLFGTDTTWTSEVWSTLFVIEFGPSGCSISSVVVHTDTRATAVLTLGPTPGVLTILDTSTGATCSFIIVVPGYLGSRVTYDWLDSDNPPLVPEDIPQEGDVWTGVVLAGTEADFRFWMYPIASIGLSSYDTISWTASIDPACTWLRLAGSYWNTAGQTSPTKFISLGGGGTAGGDLYLFLTASGINPPPSGGLKADGTYFTTVTVHYTATGPGASYTGALLVKFAISVFRANRYKANLPMPLSWTGLNTNMAGYPADSPCGALDLAHMTVIEQNDITQDLYFDLSIPYLYDSAAVVSPAVASPLLSPASIAYYILAAYVPHVSLVGMTSNALYDLLWPSSLDSAYNPDVGLHPPRSESPRILGGIGTDLTPLGNVILNRPAGSPDWVAGGGYVGEGQILGLTLAQTDLWTVSQPLSGPANQPFWQYIHYYPCARRTPLGLSPTPPVCSVSMTIVSGPHSGSVDPGAIPFDFTGGLTSVSVNYALKYHGFVDAFVTTPVITLLSPPSVSSTGFGVTADPLVYQGTFTLLFSNVPDTSTGTHAIHFGDLSWFATDVSRPCLVNLIANVVVPVATTTTTTTTPPPGVTTTTTTTTTTAAPIGYLKYEGPAVDESGCELHRVPFKLNVSPVEIRVQADPRSGLLSGDFQIGIHVQPGPMSRSQIGGVVDLVRLFADGKNVQFFSQLPQEKSKNQVVLQLDPLNLDVCSGYPYDLTFQLLVKNLLPSPFFVDLSTLHSIPTVLVAKFSQNNFMLESGVQEKVLVAVKVVSGDSGRRVLVVRADPGPNNVIVVPSGAVINLDPAAAIPVFYQITGPAIYSYARGTTVSQSFMTTHGIGSPERWGVSDVEFLSRHGLQFSSAGVLSTVPTFTVSGVVESEDIMIFVEQPLSASEKAYASKIVTISIT